MTALMPIRKGPYEQEKYEQEKYEQRTLVAREKAGKNTISQRDFSRPELQIRKYFFRIRICRPDPDPT